MICSYSLVTKVFDKFDSNIHFPPHKAGWGQSSALIFTASQSGNLQKCHIHRWPSLCKDSNPVTAFFFFFFQWYKCWLSFSLFSCNLGPVYSDLYTNLDCSSYLLIVIQHKHRAGSCSGGRTSWQQQNRAGLIKWPSVKGSQGLRPHTPQGNVSTSGTFVVPGPKML